MYDKRFFFKCTFFANLHLKFTKEFSKIKGGKLIFCHTLVQVEVEVKVKVKVELD